MNYLIVPSIREECLKKFLKVWEKELSDIQIIIIEDNPTKTFNLPESILHYSWKEIDNDLKENSWIISRQDSAIRSYGFLVAYRLGASVIFTLDDDCVLEEPFVQTHLNKLFNTPVWTPTIPGQRTRGMPYINIGKLTNVVASMGLWAGVPDYDSIQSLSYGIPTNFRPPEHVDCLWAKGEYRPLCGMNYAFKREVAVLSYFPLMGKNSLFGRFDDIWHGIILKKICDHLNLLITSGHPFIKHIRASNQFNNLVKEAPGIKYNEYFWEIIHEIQLNGVTPLECMNEVGKQLELNEDGYTSKLGIAIQIWCELFETGNI